ncbi:GtrA family protein [Sphingobacterium sp. G1-14]|jgi:putative flippase GtrA|uniref:GtrA family protein n=1 Tax=Sphingobacterium TaxID=28453 RepID=UPI000B48A7C9|nr:GtrA family protein [Sphingobacterium sp. G1-14]
MKRAESTKILKFSIVGLSGAMIDISATYFFKEFLEFNIYISHIVGFCIAVTNNFYWNKAWTFDNKDNFTKQFIAFFLTSLVGLSLSTVAIYAFSDLLYLNFYFSKILAIATSAIWNYVINRFWVFNNKDLRAANNKILV